MSTGVPVRVVIVDDAPIVRDGLTMYLDSAEDIEVVARLSNGVELLDYLDTHRVDLVLMDVRMPVMDGPTALSRLTVAHPQVRVLFMTSFDDEEIVYQVLCSRTRHPRRSGRPSARWSTGACRSHRPSTPALSARPPPSTVGARS